jgi:hypothetical protein
MKNAIVVLLLFLASTTRCNTTCSGSDKQQMREKLQIKQTGISCMGRDQEVIKP